MATAGDDGGCRYDVRGRGEKKIRPARGRRKSSTRTAVLKKENSRRGKDMDLESPKEKGRSRRCGEHSRDFKFTRSLGKGERGGRGGTTGNRNRESRPKKRGKTHLGELKKTKFFQKKVPLTKCKKQN